MRQIPRHVVKFCAEECKCQRSGEMSVWWMVGAWGYAVTCAKEIGAPPDLEKILTLGRLVEPEKNADGLRTQAVYVGSSTTGYEEKMAHGVVPHALNNLLLDMPEPRNFYDRYEDIHPFIDGNGRTGTLPYNWLNGTLLEPIHPPDWSDPVGYWRKRRLTKMMHEELWS